MAAVENIRVVDFRHDSEETAIVGHCSACSSLLAENGVHGFPAICPYCRQELENGKDSRPVVLRSPIIGDFPLRAEPDVSRTPSNH